MILGDKIFYRNGFRTLLKSAVKDDDENGRATSIEEKPKSNYAVMSLYFYPAGISERANEVKPSARGELENMTLNEMYLNGRLLNGKLLGRGFAWLDTGTMTSLLQTANFVETIQGRVMLAHLKRSHMSTGSLIRTG